MKITLEEVRGSIAPATVKDLDGSFEVEAPKGFISRDTDCHYIDYQYKSKWFKQGPFQSDEEWAELKRETPTRLQALKIIRADWDGVLVPCDQGPQCDNCHPEDDEEE